MTPNRNNSRLLSAEHRSAYRKAIGWIAAMVAFAVHVLDHDPAYPPLSAACAGLLAVFAILAVTYAQVRTVPILAVVLVHLYLSLGSAVFWAPVIRLVGGHARMSSHSLDSAYTASLMFTVVAIVLQVVVARWGSQFSSGVARVLDRPEYTSADSLVARGISIVLLVLYCFSQSADLAAPTFGAASHVVTLLTLPAVPLGLLLWDYKQTRDRTTLLLLWAEVTVMCMVGLSTGMLGNLLSPLVSLCLLTWTIQGRVPVGPVLAAVTLLLTLNSAKHVYRQLSWRSGQQLSFTEKATNWVEAINRTYSGSYAGQETEALTGSAESTASRFLTFPQIAHIFDWVPSRVPHAGPAQWLNLPLEFVPRVIWESKPMHIVEYNQRYTQTFRLQTRESMKRTAIALPPVGDGYWRLGWSGVLIEGALLGLLFGLYQAFSRPTSRALAIISCAATASMSADAHVMAHYAGAPQFAVAMVVIFVSLNLLALLVQATKRRHFSVRSTPQILNLGKRPWTSGEHEYSSQAGRDS